MPFNINKIYFNLVFALLILSNCSSNGEKPDIETSNWSKNRLAEIDSLYKAYILKDTLCIKMNVDYLGTPNGNAVLKPISKYNWEYNQEKDLKIEGILISKSKRNSVPQFEVEILKVSNKKVEILLDYYNASDTLIVPINHFHTKQIQKGQCH